MARDGSGIFSKLYTFVAGTVIEAAKMNGMFDDLVTDANAARPVTAGGTGGTSVISGWDGLAKKGSDIASASSINLTTATGPSLTITGTTAITAVTLTEGAFRVVRAAAALPLTASASLLVNGSSSVSLTCTAEDLLLFRGGAAGVVSVSRIGNAATTNLGTTIHALSAKATPVDADEIGIADSAASYVGKLVTLTNLWANYLKGKADAVYPPIAAVLTSLASLGASLVSGDIIYATAASTLARLAKGADGTVLTLASGLPSWAAPSSGGMTLLGTLTTTSGTTQSLTSIAAGYRAIMCEVEGVSFTTTAALTIATSSTNGAAYGSAGTITGSLSSSAASFSGVIWIHNIGSTAQLQVASSAIQSGGDKSIGSVFCSANTAAVVNAIQFAGGTFDAGTIRVYGVK